MLLNLIVKYFGSEGPFWVAFFRRVERVFREVIEEEERRVEQARVKSEGRDVAFGDLGFWELVIFEIY